MIFLDHLYNLPNSTTGLDNIATQTITEVPSLMYLILFFIFSVVMIGGISRQTLKTGTADYPAWALIASISTLLISLLLSIKNGFISLDVLIIVVTLNIGSAVWLYLDKRVSEV